MSTTGKGLTAIAIAIGVVAVALSGYLLATVPSQLAKMQSDFDAKLAYTPQTRALTISMGEGKIVMENETTGDDFIAGEFHRWEPDTITVYKGDTIQLTVKNPRSNAHSFVSTDFAVDTGRIPGRNEQPNDAQRTVVKTFVVDEVGVFQFKCGIDHDHTLGNCDVDHSRMVGYLIVLEP
ncbi:MAG TPA: cupredoxin domain-containing protein [Candidatus Bathyarchaeia archaeon]|nr:cupredoxin domain-containing protein [Candidatus Bathyarchaeia archaeon]